MGALGGNDRRRWRRIDRVLELFARRSRLNKLNATDRRGTIWTAQRIVTKVANLSEIILMTGQRLGGLVAHERLGRSDLRTARREMIGHQYAHEEQESETNDHHQFVFARHD